MIRHGRQFAIVAAGVLSLSACGSNSTEGSSTSTRPVGTTSSVPGTAQPDATAAATDPSSTGTSPTASVPDTAQPDATTAATDPPPTPWSAPLDDCPDEGAATAQITGTLTIGSAQPLSGTPAVAFAPAAAGLQLYLDHANQNNLVDGVTLKVDIRDDQYDPTQTPGVVSALIDSGVDIFAGIVGTPNNEAVRETLNEECIPQLLALTGSPAWGDVANYPWTTGALVPYDIEAKTYASTIKDLYGDGATVGVFSVNNEFGKVFVDAFKEAAADAGLEIVDEQSIEPAESTPPVNQVGSLAANRPTTILAVPLGAQCPTFLKELANAKAADAGWNPAVFQVSTCGSRLLISVLAGGAGDGVYTSANLIDTADPKFAANPGNVTFKTAYEAAGLTGDVGFTAVGWSVGEYLVNILVAAQQSGTLSRQSIVEAARNLEFIPTMARPGTVYKMNGEQDGYALQSLTVLQWNEAANSFTEIGPPNTSFET